VDIFNDGKLVSIRVGVEVVAKPLCLSVFTLLVFSLSQLLFGILTVISNAFDSVALVFGQARFAGTRFVMRECIGIEYFAFHRSNSFGLNVEKRDK
jgi:hypothetical protein